MTIIAETTIGDGLVALAGALAFWAVMWAMVKD